VSVVICTIGNNVQDPFDFMMVFHEMTICNNRQCLEVEVHI